MLNISQNANPNYLAKVFTIKDIKKHPNADKLQIVTVDFQPVITGLEAKEGDTYVYFPVECKINLDFLKQTNSFSKSSLNKDTSVKGFFSNSGRVKATKLRGEYSMGYIVPLKTITAFTGTINNSPLENQEFDTVNNILMVEKYVVPSKQQNLPNNQGRKPQIDRLIDGQVHLHVDTQNLRKNIHKIGLDDQISVTYKTHGTSFWVSNVLTKVKPKRWHKLFSWLPLQKEKYEILYGSRNVVKNKYYTNTDKSFYDVDIWGKIKNYLQNKIPKGITVYGEILGYISYDKFIQKPYDYGCKNGEYKFEIYRITQTNPDGEVTEFNYSQIKEYCDKYGLTPSHLFYKGSLKGLIEILSEDFDNDKDYSEEIIPLLEREFNNKDCFMCKTKLPEEGIVLRKESLYSCESYKLKSIKFLERETKQLDEEEHNV